MARKTYQYLQAGCRTVWVVYPSLRLIEVRSKSDVRQVREPEALKDESSLPGFSLSLSYIFDLRKAGK
jgi:hypothetical protein